jgi:steroid delta-isomerase-like uncharacterized protein
MKHPHGGRLLAIPGEGNMLTTTPNLLATRPHVMTTREEELMRLYEDVWNENNPETADELVHETYTIHNRELAAEMEGPELYKALASGTREIFPDLEITIEDMIASGEKVALRWTMTGTHEGSMFGVEPTGRQVKLTAIEINHFNEEKLIETWTQSDQLGLMQQLGIDIGDS